MSNKEVRKSWSGDGLRGTSFMFFIIFSGYSLLGIIYCPEHIEAIMICFILALSFLVCFLILAFRANYCSSDLVEDVEILKFSDDEYIYLRSGEFCWGKTKHRITRSIGRKDVGYINEHFFDRRFFRVKNKSFILNTESSAILEDGSKFRIPMSLIFRIRDPFSAKELYELMTNSSAASLSAIILEKFSEHNDDFFQAINQLALRKIRGGWVTIEEITNIAKTMPKFPKEILGNIDRVEAELGDINVSIKLIKKH